MSLSIKDGFLLVLGLMVYVGYCALIIHWFKGEALIGAILAMAPIMFAGWVGGQFK
jgi:hypothetical protein